MNFNRFQKTLIISVALHALLALIVYLEPSFLFPRTPTHTTIELVDATELLKKVEQMKDDQGQIVSQSDKAVNDEVDPNSKYLSAHNQRVEKQTRAELNDRFRNTSGSSGEQKPEIKAGEAKKQKEETLSHNDEKRKNSKTTPDKVDQEDSDKLAEQNPKEFLSDDNGFVSKKFKGLVPSFRPKPRPMGAQASGGGNGPSSTDDRLKDVPTGLQTMLSTREFVYYSYYNRIKEKLRQYWEPKIKEKMERVLRSGRTIASTGTERITKCVIILDEKGKLVRVQVIGDSGIVDLDQAAVEAFQAAAPFPNPPKGIVEKDGYIRIRWDFVLEANAAPLSFTSYALN